MSTPSQSCFGPRPHSVLLRVCESDFHALETEYATAAYAFKGIGVLSSSHACVCYESAEPELLWS
eukprot:6021554-Karenia_brevis.AAC.1